MGATAEGRKELIAVMDGVRERKHNWQELLLNLNQRGLSEQPKLAVGYGALGFWAALGEVYPTTREQPLEGSEYPLGLIRLPDRALGATCGRPTHRKYLRDDRPPAWPHEGQRLTEGQPHHDIQASPVSQPTLAKTQRASPNCSRSPSKNLNRKCPEKHRLIQASRTELLTVGPGKSKITLISREFAERGDRRSPSACFKRLMPGQALHRSA